MLGLHPAFAGRFFHLGQTVLSKPEYRRRKKEGRFQRFRDLECRCPYLRPQNHSSRNHPGRSCPSLRPDRPRQKNRCLRRHSQSCCRQSRRYQSRCPLSHRQQSRRQARLKPVRCDQKHSSRNWKNFPARQCPPHLPALSLIHI